MGPRTNELFEQGIRGMLLHRDRIRYYDDAKRLLELILALAEADDRNKAERSECLKLHASNLLFKLTRNTESELIRPYLNELATSRDVEQARALARLLKPAVEKILTDPCKNNNGNRTPSRLPPAA